MIKNISIIPLLLVIILSITGCMNPSMIKEDSSYYEYLIKIQPDNSTIDNYYVLIPVVLNMENKQISPVMNTLSYNKGIGSINLISTEYGNAINITGKDYVELYSYNQKKIDYGIYDNKSINWSNIYENKKYQIMVFFKSEKNERCIIELFVYVWNSDKNLGFSVETPPNGFYLDPGWNFVDVGTGTSFV